MHFWRKPKRISSPADGSADDGSGGPGEQRIQENARSTQSQEEYAERCHGYGTRYEKATACRDRRLVLTSPNDTEIGG